MRKKFRVSSWFVSGTEDIISGTDNNGGDLVKM